MTRFRNLFLTAGMAVSCVLSASAADVKVSHWKPVFIGIEQAQASIDGKDASIAYALRVDLKAPGVSFYTAPRQGSLNTIASTDTQFLEKYGLQAVINANFFAPCCNAANEDKTIQGLAVSDENVVNVPVSTDGQNAALLLTRDNKASIVTTSEETDLTNVFNAVTGSGIVVEDGENVGDQTPFGDGVDPNPRTLVGLSQDSRFLYVVVIDGRQPGYSVGTTNEESAEILLALGAYNALNLDGGGSTSLVEDNGQGHAQIINKPSGGAERFDANQLGIRALPLPRLPILGLSQEGSQQ